MEQKQNLENLKGQISFYQSTISDFETQIQNLQNDLDISRAQNHTLFLKNENLEKQIQQQSLQFSSFDKKEKFHQHGQKSQQIHQIKTILKEVISILRNRPPNEVYSSMYRLFSIQKNII